MELEQGCSDVTQPFLFLDGEGIEFGPVQFPLPMWCIRIMAQREGIGGSRAHPLPFLSRSKPNGSQEPDLTEQPHASFWDPRRL